MVALAVEHSGAPAVAWVQTWNASINHGFQDGIYPNHCLQSAHLPDIMRTFPSDGSLCQNIHFRSWLNESTEM
jgi:hypothetical protein